MYDNITPEQWIYGLLASLIAFSVMWWLFYHYTRPRDMSSAADRPAAGAGTTPVHVPVLDTGSAASTGALVLASADAAAPDTDASEAGTAPRLSLRMTDAEMIALLAAQRGKDGKHRYSANAIHALIGGSRAAVLDQVRQLRADAPASFGR